MMILEFWASSILTAKCWQNRSGFTATGRASSILAGRISYVLGLKAQCGRVAVVVTYVDLLCRNSKDFFFLNSRDRAHINLQKGYRYRFDVRPYPSCNINLAEWQPILNHLKLNDIGGLLVCIPSLWEGTMATTRCIPGIANQQDNSLIQFSIQVMSIIMRHLDLPPPPRMQPSPPGLFYNILYILRVKETRKKTLSFATNQPPGVCGGYGPQR